MNSLVSRSLVLAVARFMNQGLLMLSPILLVRLLTVAEYGRYRQFMVAAMLLTTTASFSITGNLNYFIARSKELRARYVTHSCLLLALTSGLAVLALVVARPLLLPEKLAGQWGLVALYVAAYLNFDLLPAYWLAQGRSKQVLYYTLGITSLRIGAVVGAAMWFRDADAVILASVTVETGKMVALFAFLRAKGLLVWQVDRAALGEQLRFVVPFGIGTALYGLNDNVGKILVSRWLGPELLAVYTIAAYQIPLVAIFNQTVTDVVFPDMVKRSKHGQRLGLRLWGRATVVLFMLVCPSWVLLTYFAEPLVRLLFTDAYVGATPYFQALLLLLLRYCFSFSTALRSLANNRPFIFANAVGIALNLLIAVSLLHRIGLWAPTIGLLVAHFWVLFYLGYRVLVAYGVSLSEVLDWPSLGRIVIANAVALAVLRVSMGLIGQPLLGAALGIGAYALVYLALLWRMRIDEFVYLWDGLRRRMAPATPP
jgi:O-antigen/teichoic acid export membrane protein